MSDSDSDEVEKPQEVKEGSSDSSYDEEEEKEITTTEPPADGSLVELQKDDTMTTSGQIATPQQPRRKRFIPKYEVEGVHRVILSEETQLAVEIVVGSHVNAQYPWKFVDKSKIMETIEVGGELSEFFPFKEELEEYNADLVLMGYIPDESKDYNEFYIACTIESRDHCKEQSDRFIRRQEKKLEKAVQKKPRPWTSLGSESEITELLPVYSRPLMEIEIEAKFPTVYDPDKFNVRDVLSVRDGYIELTPYRQKFNNVYRRRVDVVVQVGVPKHDRAAQTDLRYPQNVWTQSIADALGQFTDPGAGGDVEQGKADFDEFFGDEDDDESSSSEDEKKKKPPVDEVGLAAYRAAYKRMRRPSYIKKINKFVTNKSTEMDSIVELNTVMDIYCNDYPNLVTEKTVDVYDTMAFEEYICFTDVRAKDKYVSYAVFHPMWSGIVATCYSDGSPTVMKYLSTRPDPIQRAVYGLNPVMIWSHIDTLFPKLYLECPREVKVLQFCPFDENILVGGCVNGQVVVWDLTNKLENVEKIEVLSEKREKYRIAMNAHMGWMKSVQDNAVVQATVLSNLQTSHYGPITAIRWLSPNFQVTSTGKVFPMTDDRQSLMFFTGSEDGTILIWNLSADSIPIFTEAKKVKKSKRVPRRPSGLMVDVSPYKILDRNLQPCYRIILGIAGHSQTLSLQSFGMDPPPCRYIYTPTNSGTGRKYFKCEVLPQNENELPTTLYCGSQHGEMCRIEWEGHAFNTGEVVNSEYCEIKYSCRIHDGIISCTQKNPFLHNITVTVGGKIFALWSDDFKERPLMWKKRPCRLTDAVWSLYKPSLLFISTCEGDLEVWDLLLRSDQPTSIQTLSGSMLTTVSIHTLPLKKNIIGVSDLNGSFRMFLYPPIFMIENPNYTRRMEHMLKRQLVVMQSFQKWQDEWMKNNPHILLEMKRKEGALLAEKEEEKRRIREEEDKKAEEEAEARRLLKLKVIGPEERWQMIIQKLIERTIAVKKRINRAELIEHEKPLRELEAQRLKKEQRMFEIMKNQKTIFSDTVAILFPEAIQKPPKPRKTYLADGKEKLKKEYLEDYDYLKHTAWKTVTDNPYKVAFSWEATVTEGKERRQALNAYEDYVNMHKSRLELDDGKEAQQPWNTYKEPEPDVIEDDEEESEIATDLKF